MIDVKASISKTWNVIFNPKLGSGNTPDLQLTATIVYIQARVAALLSIYLAVDMVNAYKYGFIAVLW